MTDIVEMLRQGTEDGDLTPVGELCVSAADEIETLRQLAEELEESHKEASALFADCGVCAHGEMGEQSA